MTDGECLPTGTPTPEPVPALEVGKPFRYQVPSDNGAVSLEITMTALKTRPGTSSDPKGTVTVCFGFKLKNTGMVSFSGGDISAATNAKWFGLDGQQADTNPGTMETCKGLGEEWGGIDQPAPLPGKYVTGVWMYNVPNRPGAVEVTDADGSPLYRLNYGPKSAQVPIDARGQ
jgi:hypothetical protein